MEHNFPAKTRSTKLLIIQMKHLLFLKRQIPYLREGICFLFLMLVVIPLHAQNKQDLQLVNLFQDHMVLQRATPISFWGFGVPGKEVSVHMGGNEVSGKTNSRGQWKIVLPALEEKGPYIISILSGNERIELKDVLVGDVWIASGQSNMEWPVKSTNFKEMDSSWIKEAEIRLIKILPETDYQPQKESKNLGWQTLNNENIANFSAVAYHFGKSVYIETGVPLGIISANLGATTIETWMSNEALANFPQFQMKDRGSFKELRERFKEGTAEWSKEKYYGGKGIQQQWYESATQPASGWNPIEVAGNTWENVEDLKSFDGAVWFRKTFDLPENFTGDSLTLQLLQIDDHDITWVNGKKVGETFGRHNHRNYKVAVSNLKRKNNLIVVRVFDAGGIGGFSTNSFWGNELLWGNWEYYKGTAVQAKEFKSPELANVSPFSSPAVLFNGTIAPLLELGIKGVIWYQGESNELRAHEYRDLFPALIRDWRKQFDQGPFPFLFVQLANYREEPQDPKESSWAELREAQNLALKEKNTGMAVTIDIGEANDIHPKNKEDVGKRLAGLALNLAYNKDILAESPQFESIELKGDKAVVSFTYTGTGLVNPNKYGYIRGFQIAGSDKHFYWANATLLDDKVLVWSPKVKTPVAVRYAWSDNPGELDLYNSAGLPLAPFRTDNWNLLTKGVVFQDGPRF